MKKRVNKKGWIKIVEAFVSILLIMGVLLIVLDKEHINKKDISPEIYDTELAILREIQSNDSLREDILALDSLPVKWDNFPEQLMNLIKNRVPNYLICVGKICEIKDECVLEEYLDKDIYAKSITITATLETYNPRQVKLFCWVRVPEPVIPVVPEKAVVRLMFSGTEYSLVGKNHTYTSTRTFEESNGVGLNLTESQICYKTPDRCDISYGNLRIEPNEKIVLENKKFWTNETQNIFTLRYLGVDDNGYDVSVEQSLCVEGTSFTENCVVG